MRGDQSTVFDTCVFPERLLILWDARFMVSCSSTSAVTLGLHCLGLPGLHTTGPVCVQEPPALQEVARIVSWETAPPSSVHRSGHSFSPLDRGHPVPALFSTFGALDSVPETID